LSSLVACFSPRHIRRVPVSMIESRSLFFELLPKDVKALIEDSCDCFKGD